METRNAIDKERTQKDLPPIKDHQIILVGSNPLPCYVAALSLRPIKITFVCSKATKVYAEKLKNRLDGKGFACCIPDGIDDTCSTDEITIAINSIEGVSAAGLHYTGGKKTMSVHAHRAWHSKSKDITQASYIDAQKVALLFDGTGIEITLKKKPCVRFDTLVDLHGITSAAEGKRGYKTSPAIPELAMKMREIVKEISIDTFRNYWPPCIPFIRCDSSNNPIPPGNKDRYGKENIRKDDVKKAGLKRDVCLNYSMAVFNKIASSAESVGKYRFRQITKCMIQGSLQAFQRFITISLSHSQFCFKVKPLNRTGRKSAIGLEPVENKMLVFAQHLCHFFHRFQVGF